MTGASTYYLLLLLGFLLLMLGLGVWVARKTEGGEDFLVAAVLGKFWPRVTWQGGIACMVGGSATALAITASAPWTEFWGNPVVPSLLAALLAGVAVSLLTPRRDVVEEEAMQRLSEDRSAVEANPRAGARGNE